MPQTSPNAVPPQNLEAEEHVLGASLPWTAADDAEQEVLLWELIHCYHEHRPNCDHCRAYLARQPGSTPCPHLAAAIDVMLDWRERRQLLTRAEELRLDRARLALGVAADLAEAAA